MPEWTLVSLDYEPWEKGTEVFVRSADTFTADSFGKKTRAADQQRQRFFETTLKNISWHLGSEEIPVFIDFNGDRRRMDKGCIGHALAAPSFLLPPDNGPNGYVSHVRIKPEVQLSAELDGSAGVTALWKRIFEIASKNYPALAMKQPGSKGPASNWVIFKADLPPKVTIDWKIKKATVDLSFWPGAPVMPPDDMDLTLLPRATSVAPSITMLGETKVITVPLSAPESDFTLIGEQKIKEALQIASELHKFYHKNKMALNVNI